jgi:hypothetical protein
MGCVAAAELGQTRHRARQTNIHRKAPTAPENEAARPGFRVLPFVPIIVAINIPPEAWPPERSEGGGKSAAKRLNFASYDTAEA